LSLHIACCAVPALLATFPAVAQEQSASSDVNFPDGAVSVSIPAAIFNNVVYLPVRVEGSEPLEFALDTGAPDLSMVESANASALGLKGGEALTVRGASRRRLPVRRLEDVSLSIGGIEARDLTVIAMSLKKLESHWGHRMDGILGGNFLHRVVTCIEYDRERVTFVQPEHFNPAARGEPVPIEVEDNTLFVRAMVTAGDGRPAGVGRFLLDTGVRQSFVNSPFVRRHRLIERSQGVVETVTGYGISGIAFGTLGRLGSIALGDSTLEGPIVQLCTGSSGLEASTVFDGIIGADILSRFAVCIDYDGGRLFLQPGPKTFRPFAADASGLTFKTADDEPGLFSIAHVVSGSPAAEAGIRVGDVVVSVNSEPASEHDLQSLKEAMQRSGEACLRLQRDAAAHEVCFRLRTLI
jgi:hypothetical protein